MPTLASKMEAWEKKKLELDALEIEIATEVLSLKKTQVVGRCRATYSKTGGSTDYDAIVVDLKSQGLVPDWLLEEHTTRPAPKLEITKMLGSDFFGSDESKATIKATKARHYTPGSIEKITVKLDKPKK